MQYPPVSYNPDLQTAFCTDFLSFPAVFEIPDEFHTDSGWNTDTSYLKKENHNLSEIKLFPPAAHAPRTAIPK